MATTSFSTQEFSQVVPQALSATEGGPIFITDDGVPTHVLLTYLDYQRMLAREGNIASCLGMPGVAEAELEAPRVEIVVRPADFS